MVNIWEWFWGIFGRGRCGRMAGDTCCYCDKPMRMWQKRGNEGSVHKKCAGAFSYANERDWKVAEELEVEEEVEDPGNPPFSQ